MKQHPLLYGLIGFILGGLVVSIAVKWLPQPQHQTSQPEVLMSQMTTMLKPLKGDDFDKMFLTHMIEHHQAAVDMSRLSAGQAKHDELKKLSTDIIAAQEKEIQQMRDWQKAWGYADGHKMQH